MSVAIKDKAKIKNIYILIKMLVIESVADISIKEYQCIRDILFGGLYQSKNLKK